MHFCRVHDLRMSICLNLLALLIETSLTLYANSVRPFMASSRPPMLSTMSYISTYLLVSFSNSSANSSLFIYNKRNCTIYLLVYVDDIIITGNTDSATQEFIATLSHRFSIKDLGSLHYFLSVEVLPHQYGLFLSQCQYIRDLLTKTQMTGANPVATLLATSLTLTLNVVSILSDPLEYHTPVGCLQYLFLTRLNIAYTVGKLSQFMHQPTTEHWDVVKRLLHYLSGTLDHGIVLYRHSLLMLHAFSDVD